MQTVFERIVTLGLGLALLGAATGCAGRWDVPTTELRKLQGYRDGQEVTLRDKDGGEVRFNHETAIDVPVTGFRGDEVERLRFSSIRRANEKALEGTLAPRVPCSSWVGAPGDDVPGSTCPSGADGVYDLRGAPMVRVVRVDQDDPWKPSEVGAQPRDRTGLVVGITVAGLAVGVGATVGIVYLAKGLHDLAGNGGSFAAADAYRSRPGRAH